MALCISVLPINYYYSKLMIFPKISGDGTRMVMKTKP